MLIRNTNTELQVCQLMLGTLVILSNERNPT